MQIFVLGMHRSGTSAVTRLINLMGAYLGPEEALTGANPENPKGFWERRDVRMANDALLWSADSDWWKVADFDVAKFSSVAVEEFNQSARRIIQELDRHRPWVVKEPRLCLLFPLWRRLVERPVCVLVHRSPVQVAHSLQHRNGFPLSFGVALWERYMRDALTATRELPRVVISYEQVMENPIEQTERILQQLESMGVEDLARPSRREIEEFISPDLFHHTASCANFSGLIGPDLEKVHASLASGSERNIENLQHLSRRSHATLELFEDVDALLSTEPSTWQPLRARLRESDEPLRLREKLLDLAIAGEVEVEQLKIALRDAEVRLATQNEQLESQSRRLELINSKHREAHQRIEELEDRLESLLSFEELYAQSRARIRKLESELEAVKTDVALFQETAAAEGKQNRRLGKEISRLLLFLNDIKIEMDRFSRADRRRIGPLEVLSRKTVADLLGNTNAVFRELATWTRSHRAELLVLAAGSEGERAESSTSCQPAATVRTVRDGFEQRAERHVPRRHITRKRDLTVAVIAWDVGHNPLGRAYMLAEALHRHFRVILLGPSFSKYGHDVWAPVRNARIPTVPIPGAEFPEFSRTLREVAPRVQADLIVACKPRLPALQIGLLMKAAVNRPLIVDVDDDELAFFENRGQMSLDELRSKHLDPDLRRPYGETWTRFCAELLPLADEIIVSNHVLRRKYGGSIVPHARDESVFDPSLYDREATRRRLGIGRDDRMVLFAGTTRGHKGVVELARAVRELENPQYHFVVVGRPPDPRLEQQLLFEGGSFLKVVDGLPFHELPETVNAADLVCVLQDPSHEISKSQLPAKVIDALAMGVPVLASSVAPLEPLIEAGAVDVIGESGLAQAVDRMLRDAPARRAGQLARRDLFLQHFSYDVIGGEMACLLESCLGASKRLTDTDLHFIELQDPERSAISPGRKGVPISSNKGMDVVIFWKQNDTGLYGRRHDMFIKYLSRREEVRQVVVFDHPMSFELLQRRARSGAANQWRRVYQETMAKTWGLRRTEKVSHHTFVFSARQRRPARAIWDWPEETDYLNFLEDRLKEHGISPNRAVFWYYPANFAIPEIHENFRPACAVTDVVDDHRTWPNISDERREQLTEHYREVLELSDLVLTNCETVQHSMKVFRPEVHVLPNACEFEPVPDLSNNPAFRSFAALSRPIIGFAGNLEAKIDVGLLDYLATQRPGWQIVLIGSTHMNPEIMRLDKYPNVHFMGVVPYPEVRAWINEFDVAIVPHLDTEQTRSMNPLKVLVYCSLGVPVVSTRIANLGAFEKFVNTAESKRQFLQAIEQILGNAFSRSDQQTITASLAEHSWTRRVDFVITTLLQSHGRCPPANLD